MKNVRPPVVRSDPTIRSRLESRQAKNIQVEVEKEQTGFLASLKRIFGMSCKYIQDIQVDLGALNPIAGGNVIAASLPRVRRWASRRPRIFGWPEKLAFKNPFSAPSIKQSDVNWDRVVPKFQRASLSQEADSGGVEGITGRALGTYECDAPVSGWLHGKSARDGKALARKTSDDFKPPALDHL